jgi:hypothetical protein
MFYPGSGSEHFSIPDGMFLIFLLFLVINGTELDTAYNLFWIAPRTLS